MRWNTHTCIMVVDTQDLTVLQDLETIKQLGHILKTNVRACVAVGHPFVIQVYIHCIYTYSSNTSLSALAGIYMRINARGRIVPLMNHFQVQEYFLENKFEDTFLIPTTYNIESHV